MADYREILRLHSLGHNITQIAGTKVYLEPDCFWIHRELAKKSKATMRIQHKPGDAMEVDWAGGTLPIKNLITGETVPACLFSLVCEVRFCCILSI